MRAGVPMQTLLGRGHRDSHRPEPHRCSFCGVVLDPPRRNPTTGTLGRKCLTCNEWRPLASPREPKRHE